MHHNPIIGLTHGDTNGVGYELILRAFANAELLEHCTPIIFGCEQIIQVHRKTMNLPGSFHKISSINQVREGVINLLELTTDLPTDTVQFGQPTEVSSRLAHQSLETALSAAKHGEIDALVLAPTAATCKDLISRIGNDFPLILSNPQVRIAVVNADADTKGNSDTNASELTSEILDRRIRQCYEIIRRHLLCSAPRLAVLGTSEHTEYEGTLLNTEAEPLVNAVIQSLVDEGLRVFGPYGHEKFFSTDDYKHFDLVLAPSAVQGIIAFRTQGANESTCLVLTSDLVCIMPDHDALFTLAGRGEASSLAMLQAIYQAIDISRNRRTYDETHSNPLPFNTILDRREFRREHRPAAEPTAEQA